MPEFRQEATLALPPSTPTMPNMARMSASPTTPAMAGSQRVAPAPSISVLQQDQFPGGMSRPGDNLVPTMALPPSTPTMPNMARMSASPTTPAMAGSQRVAPAQSIAVLQQDTMQQPQLPPMPPHVQATPAATVVEIPRIEFQTTETAAPPVPVDGPSTRYEDRLEVILCHPRSSDDPPPMPMFLERHAPHEMMEISQFNLAEDEGVPTQTQGSVAGEQRLSITSYPLGGKRDSSKGSGYHLTEQSAKMGVSEFSLDDNSQPDQASNLVSNAISAENTPPVTGKSELASTSQETLKNEEKDDSDKMKMNEMEKGIVNEQMDRSEGTAQTPLVEDKIQVPEVIPAGDFATPLDIPQQWNDNVAPAVPAVTSVSVDIQQQGSDSTTPAVQAEVNAPMDISQQESDSTTPAVQAEVNAPMDIPQQVNDNTTSAVQAEVNAPMDIPQQGNEDAAQVNAPMDISQQGNEDAAQAVQATEAETISPMNISQDWNNNAAQAVITETYAPPGIPQEWNDGGAQAVPAQTGVSAMEATATGEPQASEAVQASEFAPSTISAWTGEAYCNNMEPRVEPHLEPRVEQIPQDNSLALEVDRSPVSEAPETGDPAVHAPQEAQPWDPNQNQLDSPFDSQATLDHPQTNGNAADASIPTEHAEAVPMDATVVPTEQPIPVPVPTPAPVQVPARARAPASASRPLSISAQKVASELWGMDDDWTAALDKLLPERYTARTAPLPASGSKQEFTPRQQPAIPPPPQQDPQRAALSTTTSPENLDLQSAVSGSGQSNNGPPVAAPVPPPLQKKPELQWD